MDSSHIPLIIAIVILIVGSAYFSATETAFSSLNRIRMKNRQLTATSALSSRWIWQINTIVCSRPF